MHRFACGSLLCFGLLSLGAFAQENRVIKVGVPVMRNRADRSVPGNIERDRLVAALNQEKPDKKLHIKIQAVALDGTTPDDVGPEAKQKNCDYVVYTTLVELRSSSDGAAGHDRNQSQWCVEHSEQSQRPSPRSRIPRNRGVQAISYRQP